LVQAAQLHRLTRLVVDRCFSVLSSDGLAALTALQHLSIQNCHSFNSVSFERCLSSTVHTLDLAHCREGATNEWDLGHLRGLTSLNLADTDYTGLYLHKLTSLRTLNVYNNDEVKGASISRIPNLTQLCMGGAGCRIRQEDLFIMAPRLRALVLYGCNISINHAILDHMTGLQRLVVLKCPLVIDKKKHRPRIQSLTQLEHLTLDKWSYINDCDMEQLPTLRTVCAKQPLPCTTKLTTLSMEQWRERGVRFESIEKFSAYQL
jgi:hypothetical protein